MHHMRVTLDHADEMITAVRAEVVRAPWSTCPGAEAVLAQTFVGAALAEAAGLVGKKRNCTHLFDIAVLAAAHAGETAPLRYDLTVGDPVKGTRQFAAARDGAEVFRWVEKDRVFVHPPEIAGLGLLTMSDWLQSLEPGPRELARLLRGAGIIAHGRQIPMDRQSDATVIPANCFTFQPERAADARRIAGFHNFTAAMDRPLDGKPRSAPV